MIQSHILLGGLIACYPMEEHRRVCPVSPEGEDDQFFFFFFFWLFDRLTLRTGAGGTEVPVVKGGSQRK